MGEESDGVALVKLKGQTEDFDPVSTLPQSWILCTVFISSKLLSSSLWDGDHERM